MTADGPDLASAGDLALKLQESRRTIYNWIERDDFPKPVAKTAGARLWDVDEVRRWRDDTAETRKPGRPKA
jgi:predicted DNA-binding transcriptional regulator AlpA